MLFLLLVRSAFFGLHGFEENVETLVAGFPEFAVVVGPISHLLDGLWFEGAEVFAAAAFFRDQVGVLEVGEVLGDGLLGDGEGFGEGGDGGRALGEALEDGAAGGVGECGEGLG